jgi:hypothetical protein
VGSTINKYLSPRFASHLHNYNTNKNGTMSFKIFEYGNPYIELLENYKCEDINELHKREGELIRLNKNICVNKHNAGCTEEQLKQQQIEYRNNPIIKEQHKIIKDKYRQTEDYKKKLYIRAHKPEHMEKHRLKANEKIKCDIDGCEILFTRANKSYHNKKYHN